MVLPPLPLRIAGLIQSTDLDKQLPKLPGKLRVDDIFFRTPNFSLGTTDDDVTPAVVSLDVQDAPQHMKEEVVDIWLLPEDPPIKTTNYLSWDAFDGEVEQTHTPLILQKQEPTFSMQPWKDMIICQLEILIALY